MGIWYKDFYLVTPEGEKQLRGAVSDPQTGEENRADVERRLTEMKLIPEDRCHITRDQVRFLEMVLHG